MANIPDVIETWQMEQPTTFRKNGDGKRVVDLPGKMVRATIPMPALDDDTALVEIAGCGICHTDLGYFYDGVPTVNQPPLTLGHEISGTVVAGAPGLLDKHVIVPAVMPCNDCPICAAGRGNRCLRQKMPGNSLGVYGGFSSHIPVPAQDLCVVDQPRFPLSHYSVIADAVTTPYQAGIRAGLSEGDLVIITGVTGGLGVYMGQVAKAMGAKVVVGIARNEEKLNRALEYGVDYVLNSGGMSTGELKNEFKAICKNEKVPYNVGWKIFECTGQAGGQEIALAFLSFLGKLVIVGFGLHVNKYVLSKLMAFDAEIMGTWGCLPKYYKNVLAMVQDGRVKIEPFVQTRPMSSIVEAFEEAHQQSPDRRIVLEPDF